MQTAKVLEISQADYLAGEEISPIKHEYIDGRVYAMSGGPRNHADIAANCLTLLATHLRGRPCRAFNSDLKVRVAAINCYYYPDVTVTCDARDLAPPGNRQYLEHPALIIEVLSPSTETIDRREKLRAYQSIQTLQEYVLVDQERQWVEVFRRVEDGWLHETLTPGDELHLHSVDLRAGLDLVYENVDFVVAA